MVKILFLKGRKRKTKELWFMGSNESKQIEKVKTDKDNTIINDLYLYGKKIKKLKKNKIEHSDF